jgi:hypothetical protein
MGLIQSGTEEVILKSLDSKNLIVKSDDLINAVYDLTLQEQRIILILISMLNPLEDKDFKLFRLPVHIFQKLIGAEGKAYYQELQDVAEKMMKRTIHIPRPDDGWLKINWLASCEYIPDQGCIELEISDKLKPYLLDLKCKYTKYHLNNILPLRSGYAIRIYELLKQYQKIGERRMTVQELREALGISMDQYRLYGHFKSKVLIKAQNELSAKTDIAFTYKEIKKGRKIESILFFISFNRPDQPLSMLVVDGKTVLEDELIEQMGHPDIYLRLQKFGFNQDQALKYVHQYPADRLSKNLDYVEQKVRKGGIEDVPAYAFKIIEENIQIQQTLFDEEKEQKEKERTSRVAAEKKFEELRELFNLELQAKVKMYAENLSLVDEVEYKESLSDFLRTRLATATASMSLEETINDSPALKSALNAFLQEKYLTEEEKDFNKWLEKNGHSPFS